MSASTFPKARPTVYKGIHMRSRLEARVAAEFDHAGYQWAYEPRAYASEEGQWLPDFEVTGPVPRHLVEVKPTQEAALSALQQVKPVFASEPDVIVVILWPHGPNWRAFAIRGDSVILCDHTGPLGFGGAA